jgi:tol-pal system protein YbgF
MNALKRINKTGLLLLAGALFVAGTPAPVRAAFDGSTQQLISRLDQMENQIQTLSRSVYRGETPPGAASGTATSDASTVSGYEGRLSALEQQQRDLIGQLEQANHQAQDLQSRLDKMQADMETRLSTLEQGHPPAPSGQQPAPATTPPADTTAGMSADELYNSAFADIRDSKYDLAEIKFRRFLSQYPQDTKAGNAQYWLSETFYVRGDYKQAAKMFAQGYQDYPQSPKAADSLLKLGLSLDKMGKKDDACLSFQQLRKQFPGDTVPANRRAAQEMKTLGCP